MIPAAAVNVAVQTGPQPTNKVAAASEAAGSLAAVLAGVMAGYGGPAITELLGAWGEANPSTTQLVVALVAAAAGYVVVKYPARAAAYNVLDKPNVPLAPVSPAP
jgi:hypothetical protein